MPRFHAPGDGDYYVSIFSVMIRKKRHVKQLKNTLEYGTWVKIKI